MGLGDVGELTPERLRETFAVALKEYALEWRRTRGPPSTSAATGRRPSAPCSSAPTAAVPARSPIPCWPSCGPPIDTNRALAQQRVVRRGAHRRGRVHRAVRRHCDSCGARDRRSPGCPATGTEGERRVDGRQRRSRQCRAAAIFALPIRTPPDGGSASASRKRSSDGDGQPRSDTATQLKFTVLTDRARLEQDVTTGQRALVQELIASATSRHRGRPRSLRDACISCSCRPPSAIASVRAPTCCSCSTALAPAFPSS